MGNKAQIIGQIFVFILAGLIFVLIISYGYRAVQQFIERGEQVAVVEIKNDFETAVSEIKRQYGSVRKLELRVPSKFDGICVVDVDNCPSNVVLPAESGEVSVDWVVDACKAKSGNVFSVPRGIELFLPELTVASPYYSCVPNVGGKVVFRIEGTGRAARLSSWE